MTTEPLEPDSRSVLPNHPHATGHATDDDPVIATLEALDEVLDELRQRLPATPPWELCEGFLTALLCTRRDIPEAEWLPVLLGSGAGEGGEGEEAGDAGAIFASPAQHTRFSMHWQARAEQIRAALQARVTSLDDEAALDPAVIDWHGLLASLPEAARTEALADGEPPPAFARDWAVGFLTVADIWADDWAPPRDKALAADLADALDCIAMLDSDDTAPPAFNLYDEDGPPTISEERMNAYGEALWAVYDLYAIARAMGPRMAPVRAVATPGRNDPCPCGSGRKYKKCCGA
ncbi:MAG: UPF0149 family protein [Comamonadaceae bacterium]|nr:UPF0149 family protein [Comamonadaceae bacterium]